MTESYFACPRKSARSNTRIEKVRQPNKCEQMCTKFREEGFGQFTTFSCRYPVGGPRLPINFRESHTLVITNSTIGILNRFGKNICFRLWSGSYPMLSFVKKGNEHPAQLDCEIPQEQIRKGIEGGPIGWSAVISTLEFWDTHCPASRNDQEWLLMFQFYCFGIPP